MFQFGIGFKDKGQKNILKERSTVSEFIVDETIFKVGYEFVFLWVAI
jgi:hypothetical protein